MKTIKLSQFDNEVRKLAEQVGKTYYSIDVSKSVFTSGKVSWEFKAYVDGKGLHTGKTPFEAIEKLKQACGLPSKNDIADVVIEMEGEV